MEICSECELPEIDCECIEIENCEDGEIDYGDTCDACGEVFEDCDCEYGYPDWE